MALNSILRKSACCLRPLVLAGQLIKTQTQTQRSYHSALFTAVNQHKASSNPLVPSFRFSSVAFKNKPSSDESLLRVIESEINCAEETDDHATVEEIPSSFPFKINDSPGQQTILLERTYQGEEIKVEVHMPDLVTGEDDDDRDGDNESERACQSSIPLTVSVSKKGGPFLELSCVAYPDEIAIDSLSVKNPENSEDQIAYEGPDFQDLDENLQKAFHKYLEIRGIKASTTNFLHEYMINKDSREYLVWLKKLQKFIEA